jgi:hypothetical protein
MYVKKSNRSNDDLGIYAGRDFPKGSTLGYYCGPTALITNRMVGSVKPADDDVAVKFGSYGLTVLNSKGKWQTIVPKKMKHEESGKESPLYLGMHYLKSVGCSYEHGSAEYEKAKKKPNCVKLRNRCVKAIKKIPPNYELWIA